MLCDNCPSGFGFTDDPPINFFQINIFWDKWMIPNNDGIEIEAYGYLKEFDFSLYKGNVKIYLYNTYYL